MRQAFTPIQPFDCAQGRLFPRRRLCRNVILRRSRSIPSTEPIDKSRSLTSFRMRLLRLRAITRQLSRGKGFDPRSSPRWGGYRRGEVASDQFRRRRRRARVREMKCNNFRILRDLRALRGDVKYFRSSTIWEPTQGCGSCENSQGQQDEESAVASTV